MALVKYGGGVSSMSGKLGGTVAARNRAGAYLRNWAEPTNQPTPSQTAHRVMFAAQSIGWAGLTDGQRKAWENWASGLTQFNRQGDAYTPTGRQMYMSCNTNIALTSSTAITDPPVGSVPPTIASHTTLFVLSSADEIDTLTLQDSDTGGGRITQIWGSPQQTTGKENLTLLYRVVAAVAEDSAINFAFQYLDFFPNVCTPGAIWKVKCRMIDPATGLSSPFLIVEGTAT